MWNSPYQNNSRNKQNIGFNTDNSYGASPGYPVEPIYPNFGNPAIPGNAPISSFNINNNFPPSTGLPYSNISSSGYDQAMPPATNYPAQPSNMGFMGEPSFGGNPGGFPGTGYNSPDQSYPCYPSGPSFDGTSSSNSIVKSKECVSK